jgi:hypothetical protein
MAVLLMLPTPGLPSVGAPAFVKIITVSPASGSQVQSDSVIKVELEYNIQVFEPSTTHYVLAPLFDTADGSGTFNHLDRVMDGKVLKQQAGTLKLTYPIRQELASPKLAKPIVCVFTLFQVKNGVILTVVGSEPVTYEVH